MHMHMHMHMLMLMLMFMHMHMYMICTCSWAARCLDCSASFEVATADGSRRHGGDSVGLPTLSTAVPKHWREFFRLVRSCCALGLRGVPESPPVT